MSGRLSERSDVFTDCAEQGMCGWLQQLRQIFGMWVSRAEGSKKTVQAPKPLLACGLLPLRVQGFLQPVDGYLRLPKYGIGMSMIQKFKIQGFIRHSGQGFKDSIWCGRYGFRLLGFDWELLGKVTFG